MSDIHLQMNAYDCLGTIQVVINVVDLDLPAECEGRHLRIAFHLMGTGEDDLREWARDALVAGVEEL